jgi:AraC family transcriptional regulator
LAKIAVASEAWAVRGDGVSNPPQARRLAAGDGWSAFDVVCTAGPSDRPFEEQHNRSSVAVVLGGTFQYRTAAGCELMTPGALMLGNAGESFTCGHQHGTGDRCISFSYTPEFFDRLAHDAGASSSASHWPRSVFQVPRLPPIRALAPFVARAALLNGRDPLECGEFAVQVAVEAIRIARGAHPRHACAEPSAFARVTRVVRMLEHEAGAPQNLAGLARVARLSPYHFLRTFQELTGTTPHQHLLRARLRRAAVRLRLGMEKISDIALECGFGDISNFNRTFRAEFGVSPRTYRRRP